MCAHFYKVPAKSCEIRNVIKHRYFKTSSITNENLHEIEFSHRILESSDKYKVVRVEQKIVNSTEDEGIDFNQDWSKLTTDNILVHLSKIGNYCKNNNVSISDERFDKFVDVWTERCFDFTDDQLAKSIEILRDYPRTSSPNVRNFVELWTALDDACIERIDQWDYDQILLMCDQWYSLHMAKFCQFHLHGFLRIGRKIKKVPPHQLVQVMFYVGVKRKLRMDMFEVEMNLTNCLDELSLNEIAIICTAFFKTGTIIKNTDLLSRIYERLIREIDTVQEVPLVSLVKVIPLS